MIPIKEYTIAKCDPQIHFSTWKHAIDFFCKLHEEVLAYDDEIVVEVKDDSN